MAITSQAPDSESLDTAFPLKGMAQIALGAATGAFVASRMSRSGLLLAAGLAFALWKKDSAKGSTDKQPEAVFPETENESDWTAPVRLEEPFKEDAPLTSLAAPNSAPANAWDDLRAALTPVLSPAGISKPEPKLEISALPEVHEPPPMGEMSICEPSSPMVPNTVSDGAALPDEIELPALPEPEAISPFLILPPADAPTTPLSLGISAPVIVPKQDAELKPSFHFVPSEEPETATGSELSAPVVVPRDVQARKSFFDWLRG